LVCGRVIESGHEAEVTREDMAELLWAWEALDAAAQRVESALPQEISAAIREQTTQCILFRTRLLALFVHEPKDG
jgi:hypothetical protein